MDAIIWPYWGRGWAPKSMLTSSAYSPRRQTFDTRGVLVPSSKLMQECPVNDLQILVIYLRSRHRIIADSSQSCTGLATTIQARDRAVPDSVMSYRSWAFSI